MPHLTFHIVTYIYVNCTLVGNCMYANASICLVLLCAWCHEVVPTGLHVSLLFL